MRRAQRDARRASGELRRQKANDEYYDIIHTYFAPGRDRRERSAALRVAGRRLAQFRGRVRSSLSRNLGAILGAVVDAVTVFGAASFGEVSP